MKYSVVIRTLGNSGLKYKALLDSIAAQTIKPEEIIVAIPEGYDLDYAYGNETILRVEKGMVTQRVEGISRAKSEYILVTDDDIEFGPSFVEDLYKFGEKHSLDCVLPMEGSNKAESSDRIDLRYPWPTRIRCAITGQMFQTNRKSSFLDVITTTAGHKVYLRSNVLDNCYLCQTGNFQCFFIKTEKAKEVHFEEELWLQQGSFSKYSAFDDSSFFYKLYLMGGTIAYALRTRYIHLDSSAGRRASNILDAKKIRYFSIARNRTVFWHRFLYQPSNTVSRRCKVLLGGLYGLLGYSLYTIIINLRPKHIKSIGSLFRGYAEAFHIIRTKQVPSAHLKYTL